MELRSVRYGLALATEGHGDRPCYTGVGEMYTQLVGRHGEGPPLGQH